MTEGASEPGRVDHAGKVSRHVRCAMQGHIYHERKCIRCGALDIAVTTRPDSGSDQ